MRVGIYAGNVQNFLAGNLYSVYTLIEAIFGRYGLYLRDVCTSTIAQKFSQHICLINEVNIDEKK